MLNLLCNPEPGDERSQGASRELPAVFVGRATRGAGYSLTRNSRRTEFCWTVSGHRLNSFRARSLRPDEIRANSCRRPGLSAGDGQCFFVWGFQRVILSGRARRPDLASDAVNRGAQVPESREAIDGRSHELLARRFRPI